MKHVSSLVRDTLFVKSYVLTWLFHFSSLRLFFFRARQPLSPALLCFIRFKTRRRRSWYRSKASFTAIQLEVSSLSIERRENRGQSRDENLRGGVKIVVYNVATRTTLANRQDLPRSSHHLRDSLVACPFFSLSFEGQRYFVLMLLRFIFIIVVSLLYTSWRTDETNDVSSLETHFVVTSLLCVILNNLVMNLTKRNR